MSLDAQLALFLNGFAGLSPALDRVFVFCASSLAYLVPLVFISLLFFSSASQREKWEIFFVTAASAVVARIGITELIRFFYHRPRPFSELPVHELFTDTAWSFPSGHAAFFFAMATAIYLYNKKWGIGFFAAALVIAVSRIIAGLHYPSDIIGGALIGVFVAWVVYHFARRVAREENQTY